MYIYVAVYVLKLPQQQRTVDHKISKRTLANI